jgi:glycosyltransferase involved in cell wall biosynthesis
VTVSEVDRRLLLTTNPRLRVDVIPNGVDTKIYQPLPEGDSTPALVFVGNMDYRPNVDAMMYFCSQVLPRVRCALPDVQMWIVGINPRAEVRHLEGEGVHVTGRVDDVRPYYARSTACVVPLRAGGGTRLKILEAMAFGRPVVSTTIGCEGLDVVDGEHLFIADSADEFAEQTVRLLLDEALRRRVATEARRLAETCYDWDVVVTELEHVYREVAECSDRVTIPA